MLENKLYNAIIKKKERILRSYLKENFETIRFNETYACSNYVGLNAMELCIAVGFADGINAILETSPDYYIQNNTIYLENLKNFNEAIDLLCESGSQAITPFIQRSVSLLGESVFKLNNVTQLSILELFTLDSLTHFFNLLIDEVVIAAEKAEVLTDDCIQQSWVFLPKWLIDAFHLRNNLDLVRLIVKHGTRADTKMPSNPPLYAHKTPLLLAIDDNRLDVIQIMLTTPLPPFKLEKYESPDYGEITYATYAILNDKLDIAHWLIAQNFCTMDEIEQDVIAISIKPTDDAQNPNALKKINDFIKNKKKKKRKKKKKKHANPEIDETKENIDSSNSDLEIEEKPEPINTQSTSNILSQLKIPPEKITTVDVATETSDVDDSIPLNKILKSDEYQLAKKVIHILLDEKNARVVITGGFVRRCFWGNSHPPSDIDIAHSLTLPQIETAFHLYGGKSSEYIPGLHQLRQISQLSVDLMCCDWHEGTPVLDIKISTDAIVIRIERDKNGALQWTLLSLAPQISSLQNFIEKKPIEIYEITLVAVLRAIRISLQNDIPISPQLWTAFKYNIDTYSDTTFNVDIYKKIEFLQKLFPLGLFEDGIEKYKFTLNDLLDRFIESIVNDIKQFKITDSSKIWEAHLQNLQELTNRIYSTDDTKKTHFMKLCISVIAKSEFQAQILLAMRKKCL